MSRIDAPEGPWVEPMIRAKATDPRNGRPSWNRLAELAGVGPSTITHMVRGTKRTSPETIQRVADVLRVPAGEVSAWLGLTRRVGERYAPPPEADLLTPRQREAVNELIRAIVADEQRAGAGDGNATPTNLASVTTLRTPSPPKRVAARTTRRTPPENPDAD